MINELLKHWNREDILKVYGEGWHSGTYIIGIAPLNVDKEFILKHLNYTDDRYMTHFSKFIKHDDFIEFKFSVFTD